MFIWPILLLYVLKKFWCQLPYNGQIWPKHVGTTWKIVCIILQYSAFGGVIRVIYSSFPGHAKELHELTWILVTQISVTLATYIPTINHASTERNKFPHILLYSTETFIQDLSTILYTVLSHGTVDAVFFTKLSATLFEWCIWFEVLQINTLYSTAQTSHADWNHLHSSYLAQIPSGDNATNMWTCMRT